jgi:hypothetical protein
MLAKPKLPILQHDLYQYSSLISRRKSAEYTEISATKHTNGTQASLTPGKQALEPVYRDRADTKVTLETTQTCPLSALAFGNYDGQISKTESRRYGALQYIALQQVEAKHTASSGPARTQIILGHELAYQVTHFDELENHGLSKKTLTQLKDVCDIAKQREILLRPFFTNCTNAPSVQLRYFGLNSVGELLKNFSMLINQASVIVDDNHDRFDSIGLNVFQKPILERYFAHSLTQNYAAQNISITPYLPEHPPHETHKTAQAEQKMPNPSLVDQAAEYHANDLQQNIAQLVSMSPDQVHHLLTQPAPADQATNDATTVADFLDQASPAERLRHYQHTDSGQRLFTTYLLIVNAAQSIKNVLYAQPLEISQKARRPVHD